MKDAGQLVKQNQLNHKHGDPVMPFSYRCATVGIAAAGVGKTWLTIPDPILLAAGILYPLTLWLLTSSERRITPTLTGTSTALLLLILARSNNEAAIAFAPLIPSVALATGMAAAVGVTALIIAWAAGVGWAAGDSNVGISQITIAVAGAGLFLVEFSRVLKLERAHAKEVARLSSLLERRRVAQEVHDGVGHFLSAAIVHLEAARLHRNSEPQAAEAAVARAQGLVQEGLGEIRGVVTALRDRSVEPLEQAMEELILENRRAGIETEVSWTGTWRRLPPDATWALYSTLQESLTNVRKHAKASRVQVTLEAMDRSVELTIIDDGVGCDSIATGNGLSGIVERSQSLGGQASWSSGPGDGFRLQFRIATGAPSEQWITRDE